MTALPNPFPSTIRTIGVFSPAGIPDSHALERGVRRLSSWGLEVRLSPPGGEPVRFLAAADRVRAGQLNDLLDDPGIDCLLAARGGYGCGRILECIAWKRLK